MSSGNPSPVREETGTTGALSRNITLTWNSASFGSELGYYIERDTVNTFNSANLLKVTVAAATVTYTDIAPVAAATYRNRILQGRS